MSWQGTARNWDFSVTILITGGGGFLGAWIIKRLLARDIAVRVFDHKTRSNILYDIAGETSDKIDWIDGDISDRDAVASAARGCRSIIHLAAMLTPACADDPVRGAQVNLIGTLHVFEAARINNMRQIAYASSAGVFGPDDGKIPFPETHYGAFKLACEGVARADG